MVTNCRHILPGRHTVGFARNRLRAGGGPGENNYLWAGFRDLFVGDFLAGWNNHGSAGDVHKLGDPGWGTDAWIGPSLAIGSHPWPTGLRVQRDSSKLP